MDLIIACSLFVAFTGASGSILPEWSSPVKQNPARYRLVVTAVKDDKQLLSVGADDGLGVGQQMLLFEGGRFRASVLVTTADPDRCVVTVLLKRDGFNPAKGDRLEGIVIPNPPDYLVPKKKGYQRRF